MYSSRFIMPTSIIESTFFKKPKSWPNDSILSNCLQMGTSIFNSCRRQSRSTDYGRFVRANFNNIRDLFNYLTLNLIRLNAEKSNN